MTELPTDILKYCIVPRCHYQLLRVNKNLHGLAKEYRINKQKRQAYRRAVKFVAYRLLFAYRSHYQYKDPSIPSTDPTTRAAIVAERKGIVQTVHQDKWIYNNLTALTILQHDVYYSSVIVMLTDMVWIALIVELSKPSDFRVVLTANGLPVKEIMYTQSKKIFFKAPFNGIPKYYLGCCSVKVEFYGIDMSTAVGACAVYDCVNTTYPDSQIDLNQYWRAVCGTMGLIETPEETIAKARKLTDQFSGTIPDKEIEISALKCCVI